MEASRSRLEDLADIQREVAGRVRLENAFRMPPQLVAGVDLAFLGDDAVAACVVVSYASMMEVEAQSSASHLDFPYVPTFLAFREGPAIEQVMGRLRAQVDVFLLNAQGIAHPRRCGCASQVGVETGKPTIGVTENRLYGEFISEPSQEGDACCTNSGRRAGRLGSKVAPGFEADLHLSWTSCQPPDLAESCQGLSTGSQVA